MLECRSCTEKKDDLSQKECYYMSSEFGKVFGVCWRNWIAHLTTVEEHPCANMLSSGGSRFESWVDRGNTRLRPRPFSSLLRDRTECVHRTTDRFSYLSLERFPEVSGSAEGFPIHILRKMHTFLDKDNHSPHLFDCL